MAIMLNNVYDYFSLRLGEPPHDLTLQELSLGSPCGKGCKLIIDAASVYLQIADVHSDVTRPMLKSVNVAVEICWRG